MTRKMIRFLPMALLAPMLVPASVFAQDSPKVGLVMATPTGVGIIWHITDRVAIRPGIGLAFASSETPLSKSDGTSIDAGFSVLFYTARWDNVRSYISGRYFYEHGTTESSSTEVTSTGHDITGSVGVEFTPHRRFGVFGEVGFGPVKSTTGIESVFGDVKATTWRVRSSVGAILYF